MASHGHVLGIDFGTSNSAAAYLDGNVPRMIDVGCGQQTIPTAFFFDFETRQTLIGEPANAALLDGAEGRFMRALKRVLGTTLMHEKRQILNERVTFVDIIARFLGQIKERAEADSGLIFDRAVSGRPVVFHRAGDPREEQAEADLRACYLAAGFKDVIFVPEPEAAALASGVSLQQGETGLIVDIGGGTSDFSLFRAEQDRITILANYGVRIGGTDFDRSISIDRVMPLLGKGTALRKTIGPGTSPAPNAIFNDLATWEKIPFLYTAANRRMAQEMTRLAEEPEKLRRLEIVLSEELGHDLAFSVERGKIGANSAGAASQIDLEHVEPGLRASLNDQAMASILAPHSHALSTGVQETMKLAGVEPSRVDHVIYVGGSSLMTMVSDTMKSQLAAARHSFSQVFTVVTEGLALATTRMGR